MKSSSSVQHFREEVEMPKEDNLALQCLGFFLKPSARFCLRHSLRIQDLLEVAKVSFIDAAKEEIEKSDTKVNISRLSVMTGIHRRDVMRIYQDEQVHENPLGLVARIIGQWQNDKRFTTKAGRARVLSYGDADSEFHSLVAAISQDIHPGTVIFELERLGAIKKTSRGLRLEARAYVPHGDVKEGFSILGSDIEDLAQAVEENVFIKLDTPNHHARTEYDNVRGDKAKEIRSWFYKEGSAFHQRARNFLSKFDLDISPAQDYQGPKARVVLGSFSRLENLENKDD